MPLSDSTIGKHDYKAGLRPAQCNLCYNIPTLFFNCLKLKEYAGKSLKSIVLKLGQYKESIKGNTYFQ